MDKGLFGRKWRITFNILGIVIFIIYLSVWIVKAEVRTDPNQVVVDDLYNIEKRDNRGNPIFYGHYNYYDGNKYFEVEGYVYYKSEEEVPSAIEVAHSTIFGMPVYVSMDMSVGVFFEKVIVGAMVITVVVLMFGHGVSRL